MLTTSEKTFISNWEEQKKGPRWKYYLQFTIAWGVVSFLCMFFLVNLLFPRGTLSNLASFLVLFFCALIIGLASTHLVYKRNEKRMHSLMKKHYEGNGKSV